MKSRLDDAKSRLKEGKWSCVIMVPGKEPVCSGAIGIKPLMSELRRDRKAFDNGVIADKVVGKAAALMAVLGGARAVYGEVMSEGALRVLEKYNVYTEYGILVAYIENREHTGKCPMEDTVWEIEEPEIAFPALENTIAKLMSKSGERV